MFLFFDHPDTVRRLGVLRTFKNLIYSAKHHTQFLDQEMHQKLAISLAVSENNFEESNEYPEYIQDELMMPSNIQRDSEEQLLILECILCLTSTKKGRELLRPIYPVIRDYHKRVNVSKKHVEVIELIVGMLINDE